MQNSLAFSAPTEHSTFNFGNHPVRIVMRDEEPWFVASDICAALGYANTSKAVADHLDADERSNEQLDRSRMGSKSVIINESGLYALVLRSRKPEARRFAKWVTGEVLPSIRKVGSYQVPGRELTVIEMVDCLVKQVQSPNDAPTILFMPLVNAVLRKQGFDVTVPMRDSSSRLPSGQAKEITERLDRLSKLFHPMSSQFSDVRGIRCALRGLHPRFAMRENGYLPVL